MTDSLRDEPPLIPDQRRELLMRHLRREQVLSVHQLTELLGVSHMTVRRDIATLEDDGRVTPIPGGVRLVTRVGHEPSRAVKNLAEAPQKNAIAREAAALVRDDMVIYLDAGTTTLAVAARIADRSGLTVITNDFAIVDELAVTGEIETVHIGGRVDFDNRSTVGLIAAGTLRGLNIDLALISASSWSTRQGVTTPSPEKVQVKTAAMDASLTSVLVADSTKHGTFSLYKAADLTDFNAVITDDALPARAAENLRTAGVDLTLARVG